MCCRECQQCQLLFEDMAESGKEGAIWVTLHAGYGDVFQDRESEVETPAQTLNFFVNYC